MSTNLEGMSWDDAIQQAFAGRLGEVLEELMPGGSFRGREYLCFTLSGGPGHDCATDIHYRGRPRCTPGAILEEY